MQKLRFDHHIKKVQRLSKDIKFYIKSNKIKQSPIENSSFLSERVNSQESSITKIKAKHKLNLSIQVKLENKRRNLLSRSIQKLQRKDTITEKIKTNLEKKKTFELKKTEAIQIRLRTILHQQRQKTQQ